MALITVPPIEEKVSSGVISKVEELRNKIFRGLQGDSFSQGVLARPPLRGTYGMATIRLKEGAVPFTAKAFCMHGERAEA